MRRFLMILLAALTLQGAMAQLPDSRNWRLNPSPMSPKEHVAYWNKLLELTPSQRQQIERLNLQYADLFRGAITMPAPPKAKPNDPARKNWRTKGKAPMPPKAFGKKPGKDLEKRWKEYEKSLKKILSKKQYKEYEKRAKQLRKR